MTFDFGTATSNWSPKWLQMVVVFEEKAILEPFSPFLDNSKLKSAPKVDVSDPNDFRKCFLRK